MLYYEASDLTQNDDNCDPHMRKHLKYQSTDDMAMHTCHYEDVICEFCSVSYKNLKFMT